MAELDKLFDTTESVDDILAEIFNDDGSFNSEFSSLVSRYVSEEHAEVVPVADLSDRSFEDDMPREKVEYDSGEISFRKAYSADDRIEKKMPEDARDFYVNASYDAQRPEFTSQGDVRYPTMGVGASEQRVVYDADWEERAKAEAQRLERVRQERMLRGDSAYARNFVTSANYASINPYVDNMKPRSPYIDPLSRDDDLERADINSAYFNSNKKPFFPEGFSAAPKSNAAGGKTVTVRSGNTGNRNRNNVSERTLNSFATSYESSKKAQAEWLQVDEKPQKKRSGFLGALISGKKEKNRDNIQKSYEPYEELLPDKTAEEPDESNAFYDENEDIVRQPAYTSEELEEVNGEASQLRSTVADIVDKYNKRTEEDNRKRFEEEVRREDIRRQEELRERRRQEEIRLMKDELSPELQNALDTSEEFEEYEDFSTVKDNSVKSPTKHFAVVFDPDKLSGEEFTEKLEDNRKKSKKSDEKVEKPTLDSDWDTENFINEIRSAISYFAEDRQENNPTETQENTADGLPQTENEEKNEAEKSDDSEKLNEKAADIENKEDRSHRLEQIIEMTEKLVSQEASDAEKIQTAEGNKRHKRKFGKK